MPSPMEGDWDDDLTNDLNTARYFFVNQGASFLSKIIETSKFEFSYNICFLCHHSYSNN
jgi:hypothetical protein